MKVLLYMLPVLLLLGPSPLLAGDIDAGAKSALEQLSSAWRSASADGLKSYFPSGDAKVSLHLDSQADGSYSTKQAAGVLKAYFGRVTVTKVDLRKDGYQGGGNRCSATYNYEYTTQNGQKASGLLNISIEKQNGQWVLSKIQVD